MRDKNLALGLLNDMLDAFATIQDERAAYYLSESIHGAARMAHRLDLISIDEWAEFDKAAELRASLFAPPTDLAHQR